MELDKDSICFALNNFPFPRDSYWVVMGAALVLYGIKETTRDIDLGCSDELFYELIKKGYPYKISSSGKLKIDYSDVIHIYKDWIGSKNIVNDLNVLSLRSIINDKKSFSREKDLNDIKLIELWMKKNDKLF